jgi:hypothetical protein
MFGEVARQHLARSVIAIGFDRIESNQDLTALIPWMNFNQRLCWMLLGQPEKFSGSAGPIQQRGRAIEPRQWRLRPSAAISRA